MNGYGDRGGGWSLRNLAPTNTGGVVFLLFVGALLIMGILTVQFSGHVQL